MPEKKALIGMSGGVDSSVAAWLMLQEGYSCTGCNLLLYGPDASRDAAAVCRKLSIPLIREDLREDFRCHVLEKFSQVYESGATPNPCVDCNRFLKFGRMLELALEKGFDTIVTGHYAQIRFDSASGRYLLYRAADKTKDQTYFLYSLTQHQLKHSCFPLGGLTKDQVRRIALEQGFVNARKRDSQDICFVPDGDYLRFLEEYRGMPYPSGDFLDLEGNPLGRHRGAVAYTLGQRKGLGLAMGAPVYVCRKDMARNTVTVGPNEALYSRGLRAEEMNWIPFPAPKEALHVTARTRHSQAEHAATVYPQADGSILVAFDAPQRAVSPGQAVVLYQGDLVIGGGTITEALDQLPTI